MKIELSKYRASFEYVENFLKRDRQHQNICETISIISVATHIPIIVIALYVSEIKGMTPDIEALIARLVEFYGYEQQQ